MKTIRTAYFTITRSNAATLFKSEMELNLMPLMPRTKDKIVELNME